MEEIDVKWTLKAFQRNSYVRDLSFVYESTIHSLNKYLLSTAMMY